MGEESERDTEMFNQVPISIQVFGEYKIYSKIQRKKTMTQTHTNSPSRQRVSYGLLNGIDIHTFVMHRHPPHIPIRLSPFHRIKCD